MNASELEIIIPNDLTRLFVIEYVVDFSVPKAAKRAGVSVSHAYTMLERPEVRALVNEEKRRYQDQVDVSVAQTINWLLNIATASIADVMDAVTCNGDQFNDADGLPLNLPDRIRKIPENAQYAIKSITWTKYGPKIEMHDKIAAIERIGKFQGIFNDDVTLRVTKEPDIERIGEGETLENAAALYAETLKVISK